MFVVLGHVTPDRFNINVKWCVSLFCTSAVPVVCYLISADSQSADLMEASLEILQAKGDQACCCVHDRGRAVRRAFLAPWVSVIMKRRLSSVTPSILMQESMTFPTVLSFGVLRWTICSNTVTQKSQIHLPITIIELLIHLHWPLTSLTINSNLY